MIWEQHPEPERWREERFRVFFANAIASGGALVAIDRTDGRIIGSSRYWGYDPERSEVEIGWTFLARSHWGGAVNGQMKELMLDHAFRSVEHVVFLIGPENVRSQRSVEKLGATLLPGRRVNAEGREGVVYEISRSG